MTADAPTTPENSLLLRQMQGTRREMTEREAHTIDLVNRLILRIDTGFARMREEMTTLSRAVAGTHAGISTVRRLAEQVDKDAVDNPESGE